MRVSIGDLDYYYAKDKINCFNPDVMKISSFHKQNGDQVNFVMKSDDIYRPFDLYYIVKENSNTPNAPFDFYTNCKVRWGGKAYNARINWRMSDTMLACRPDYLLYPEKNTDGERAEQIRFLNNKGELLPIKQSWRNAFKNKRAIVTDNGLWTTSRENLKVVLTELQNVLNVTFFEPIWIPKLLGDEELINLFLKLHVYRGSKIKGVPITRFQYQECKEIILRLQQKGTNVKIEPLVIKLFNNEHWTNHQAAVEDGNGIKEIIVDAKKNNIAVELKMIKSRMDTPYFILFETVSNWLKKAPRLSGLEGITIDYGPGLKGSDSRVFWAHPEKGNEVFRDLLRQTYSDINFLITQFGNHQISVNDLPGIKGQEVFKYGL